MRISTAQRIDGLLANEVFPTFVNHFDYFKTLQLKMRELEEISRREDLRGVEKCAFEIAAITINFLETGLVSP